jgi:hypothetical protein
MSLSIRRRFSPFVATGPTRTVRIARLRGIDAAIPARPDASETAMHSTAALNSSPALASVRDVSERLRARGRAVGALVMTGFGALWAGLGAARTDAGPPLWAAAGLLAVALTAAAVRLLRANPGVTGLLPADVAERRRRTGRIFAWACAGEGVGILLAVNLVVNLGHPQWQPAAIMGVVGLHFLPLAVGFGYRPHLVTGAAMTAWALAYPWLLAAGAMAPIGPLVAGAVLFASAAWALRSVARRAA